MVALLRRAIVFRFVLGLVVLAAPASAAPSAPLTVFAAASLKNALDDVGAEFMATTHVPVRFSYAASSALARQVEQGAPADVFISADPDWMGYLAKRQLIVARSRRDVLTNHLALIAPADSKIRLRVGVGMPLAAALGSGRLAVAGPEVPAGKYARASLTSFGVWDSVKDKLAPAENVRAALTFVARDATPLGIVYDTDAKVEPGVRIVGLFPDASHPPIIYPAAVISASRDPSAAVFVDFLRSPRGAGIFRRYGFIVLPPRR
ncbi:MAG TPA: molybdate ABC transporter substrate-binding protein [Caulobacteraceae bacterium]